MLKNMKLTPKLIVLFLIFGILPMVTLGYIAYKSTEDIEASVPRNFQGVAETIADKIDRNLFERYGDVQAFALNHAIYNRYDWYQVGPENNAIVAAMDEYVKTYGIYHLTILVDLEGKVIAVNSVDAGGHPINTAPLYQDNFADHPFFKAVATGNFTRKMPFSAPDNRKSDGTFIEDLHICPDVKTAYFGNDGLTLGFSAPVYENGKIIAYWTNRAKFSLVEEFFQSTYAELQAKGFDSAELTLLDADGRIIVDYDPAVKGTSDIVRDFNIIMKFNLADKGVVAAQEAVDGGTGNAWSFHARKKINQATGYAHLKGALGYPGMNWSVLARVTRDEAIVEILATRRSIFLFGGGFVVLILVLGLFIGRAGTGPLVQMSALVKRFIEGDTGVRVEVNSGDEIGQLGENFNGMIEQISRAQEEAQKNLQEATLKANIVENAAINIIVADADYNIVYLNPASVETFRKIADVLPCRPDEIMGKNIDFFHKDPTHQRRLLADPSNLPHRAQIQLGDQFLDLSASVLNDENGDFTGHMVNWAVVTEQVHLGEESRRQAEEIRQRGEVAEAERQHVLKVAAEVLSASNEVASAAEQLSASSQQLSQGSDRQKQMAEGTSAAIQQLATSARGVSDSTGNLAQLVTDNSAAMNQLAASVVSVTQNAEQMSQTVITNSSAIEELAASIQTQAQSAEQANDTAQQANQMADDGAQVVRQAIDGMSRIAERVRSSAATINELGRSSEEISTIVAVINDIADQTNLLALNAAIEAARAGEQGRGFAVVAEEVRKLADRTSKATQEIDEKIARIQSDTQGVVTSMEEGMQEVEQGTELAARSGEALEQIGQGIGQVNNLMGQLTSASRDQATTSDEIVHSTTEMNELVQQVTTAMGQQSQAVEVVSQSFDEMQQMVNQVNQAMGEQSGTADDVARSMEEVNQIAQESQVSVREMNQSAGNLAEQAESLKQLASSIEDQDESGTGEVHNGRDGRPQSAAAR